MMKELIAGRLTQDGRPIATIMVDLFFQGLQGGVVLRRNAKTPIYVNPAAFLKLFLDYMLKIREQALKAKAAKQNSKGSGGGIRIVLQNPIGEPYSRSRRLTWRRMPDAQYPYPRHALLRQLQSGPPQTG